MRITIPTEYIMKFCDFPFYGQALIEYNKLTQKEIDFINEDMEKRTNGVIWNKEEVNNFMENIAIYLKVHGLR